MHDFTEVSEHSKFLLSKEWLVKIDNHASTPYLIKFFSSTVDISCCVLMTDTKSVWVEVMTSSQFARRWRHCNSMSSPPYSETEDENVWRITMLELLSKVHTLGGITDLSFAVSESHYADCAFGLGSDSFKWRWETYFLGYKNSAEVISRHLILPLISANYLAFSSADILADVSDAEVEKAVDKVGRIARRTVDIHIRNAISKPRVATTLRRMTAMVNFVSDLPAIISIAEKPDFQIDVQAPRAKTHSRTESEPRAISPRNCPPNDVLSGKQVDLQGHDGFAKSPIRADSATESEGEFVFPQEDELSAGPSGQPPSTTSCEPLNRGNVMNSRDPSPLPSKSNLDPSKGLSSDSESSPARPAKKPKKQAISSSEDDSEEERKRRVAQLKRGAGGAGAIKRGTRQPIRRGGKRF